MRAETGDIVISERERRTGVARCVVRERQKRKRETF